jgi:hypothetical protein
MAVTDVARDNAFLNLPGGGPIKAIIVQKWTFNPNKPGDSRHGFVTDGHQFTTSVAESRNCRSFRHT